MNQDFLDLLRLLLEAGARFLVVGAHAMAVHGVPRATGNLDIRVDPEPANAERTWNALMEFGAPVREVGVARKASRPPESSFRSGSRLAGSICSPGSAD